MVGDHLFTQEQRDKEEWVVCYEAATGNRVWYHAEPCRFNASHGDVGPRATPTYHDRKLYTLGAEGILNCLDATTGKSMWRKDLREDFKDFKGRVPRFGVSSSPLVIGERVYVLPGMVGAPWLIALDALQGEVIWKAEPDTGAVSYSSPHFAKLAGLKQILAFTTEGLFGHDPTTGKESASTNGRR